MGGLLPRGSSLGFYHVTSGLNFHACGMQAVGPVQTAADPPSPGAAGHRWDSGGARPGTPQRPNSEVST